jgi:RNA polymerase sigma-70 factor, ECF subfamily
MQTVAEWSDGDLAREAASRAPGSAETAESELYRRFAPRVRLYGLRHLRDEEAARDLAQQVLLLTIQKLREGSVKQADQIASFVLGVSRTMAKDLKRREKLRDAFLEAEPVAAAAADAALDVDRLESTGATRVELGRYVLEHSASAP